MNYQFNFRYSYCQSDVAEIKIFKMKKEVINVVRVEHPSNGLGFWMSKDEYGSHHYNFHTQLDAIVARHNGPAYPTYWEDKFLRLKLDENKIADYKFAFNTIDQLNIAFKPWEIKECIKLGFRVILLTVDNYVKSDFQTVYKNPITTQDITDLYK